MGETPSWEVATRKGVWRKKGKVISEEQLQNQYELLLATQRASCSGGGPTIIFIFPPLTGKGVGGVEENDAQIKLAGKDGSGCC